MIDEVLGLQVQGSRVRRIATLEIDLGSVSREQAPAELARRLFAQLSAALGWSPEQASAASVVDERERTAGEHLLDFLRTGQLAWSVAGDLHQAHRQLLRQVLASSQAEQVLRTVLGEARMLTRLIRQFDAGQLLEVARVLCLSRPDRHALFAQAERELRARPATEHRWRQLLLQSGTAQHGELAALAGAIHGVGHADLAQASRPDAATPIAAAARNTASTAPLLPGHAGLQNDSAELLEFAMPPSQTGGGDNAISDVALAQQNPLGGARDRSKARLPADIATSRTSATAQVGPGATLALAIEQGDVAELQRMWPEIVTTQRAQFLQAWQQLPQDTQRRHLADFSRQFSPVQQAELAQMLASFMPASPVSGDAVLAPMADRGQALASADTDSTPPSETLALAILQGNVAELQRMWPEIVGGPREHFLQVWQQLPLDSQRRHLAAFSRQFSPAQQAELAQMLESFMPASPVAGDAVLADGVKVEMPAATDIYQTAITASIPPSEALALAIQQGDVAELQRMWPEIVTTQREQFLQVWQQLPLDTQRRHLAAFSRQFSPAQQADLAQILKLSVPVLSAAGDVALADGAKTSTPADTNIYQSAITASIPPSEVLALAIDQGDVAQLQRLWPEIVTTQRAPFLQVWQQLPLDIQRRHLADFSRQFSPTQQAELAQMLASSMPASPAVGDAVLPDGAKVQVRTDTDIYQTTIAASIPPNEALALAIQQGDVAELQRMWPEIVGGPREHFLQVWQQLPLDSQRRYLANFSRQFSPVQQAELAQMLASSIPVSSAIGDAMLADGAKVQAPAATDIYQTTITALIPPSEALALTIKQGDVAELQRMWPEIVTIQRVQFLQVWQQLPLDTQRRHLAHFSRQFSPAQQAELAQMLASFMPASPVAGDVVLADGAKAQVPADTGMLAAAVTIDSQPGEVLALAIQQGDVAELQRMWPEIVTTRREQFLQVWQQLPLDTQRRHLADFSRQFNPVQQAELAQMLEFSMPASPGMGDAVLAGGAKVQAPAATDIYQTAILALIPPSEALALAI
ncbi:contractile injection system tape measure protein, partial [Janthinobacterium sp. Mn2066]|uniref:contractile injection system tape measure protein n=1 Tax=Janthinobacterium sp. Mn2066 TaxID=3395264 RepID=UPI003BE0023A